MPRRHPDWIKVKAPGNPNYLRLKRLMREKNLHTVCEEARCPNIGECWGNKTATFLILGDTCTRGCRFCAIDKGKPLALDPEEPRNVGLGRQRSRPGSHRRHFGQSRRSSRRRRGAFRQDGFLDQSRSTRASAWSCSFPTSTATCRRSKRWSIQASKFLNHNIETVPRLYGKVRPGHTLRMLAEYLERSEKAARPDADEIRFHARRRRDCRRNHRPRCATCAKTTSTSSRSANILQPSDRQLKVERYVTPEEFQEFKVAAEQLGFRHVESGPLVRSSYHAWSHVPLSGQAEL